MAKRPVGEASVKISVDGVDDVKKGMRDVRAETEDTNRTLNDTVEAADAGINAFRKWAGVLGFVSVGVAGVVKALTQLSGGLGDVQKQANEMGNAIRNATDPKQVERAAETLRSQVQENANFIQRSFLIANGELERSGGLIDEVANATGRFVGLFSDAGKEQAELFRQIQSNLTEQAETRRRELEAIEARNREEELTNELTKARLDQLDGIARIEAEYAEQRRARNEQIQEAQLNFREEEVQILEQIAQEEAKIAADKIRAIRDQQAAEAEALRQQQAAEAQSEEDRAARELAAQMREVRRALEQQAQAINENTRELNAMRQRVINFTPDIRRGSQALTRRTR